MSYKLDNVLLVDDDELTNYLNLDMISRLGIAHHINIVEDGSEALAFVKDNWINDRLQEKENNLIILDINMPRMGAFPFLEQLEMLRKTNPIYVVLLTTSKSERDIERARHFNVSSFISKPLSTQKLYSALQIL